MRTTSIALALLMLLGLSCDDESLMQADLDLTNSDGSSISPELGHATHLQRAELIPFLPAGEFGGPDNVLVPGTFFPPVNKSFVIMKRGHQGVSFKLHTTGLPPGAYTVWYVIFNDPFACTGPGAGGGVCGDPDLFLSKSSVVWATGNIVGQDGVGNFSNSLKVGEVRSETVILGEGLAYPLENPKGAEIQLVVKYHGLPSEDKDVLYAQTHTLLGNCGPEDGANSFDAGPFGIQCFDPQIAIFASPLLAN